jgi:hypothetical protein
MNFPSTVTPPPQQVEREGSRPGKKGWAVVVKNWMDFMNLIKNGDGEKDGLQNKVDDDYVKVTISRKAESTVGAMLSKVNNGFEGGRVNRQNLISWILVRFSDECDEQEIRAIRADHFDELVLLELCLKRAKQAGSLPADLRKLLLAQAGLDDTGKKPGKKNVDAKVNQ